MQPVSGRRFLQLRALEGVSQQTLHLYDHSSEENDEIRAFGVCSTNKRVPESLQDARRFGRTAILHVAGIFYNQASGQSSGTRSSSQKPWVPCSQTYGVCSPHPEIRR